jgi:hypothetical protein
MDMEEVLGLEANAMVGKHDTRSLPREASATRVIELRASVDIEVMVMKYMCCFKAGVGFCCGSTG